MSQRHKGTVYRSRDGSHLVVRLTLPDGTKSSPVHLPPGTHEADAREVAAKMYGLSRANTRSVPRDQTWNAWAERWFAYRSSRGQTSVRQDEGRWRKWISPVIGGLRPSETQREHLEAIVQRLDEAQHAGQTTPKNARNVWGVVKSAMRTAVRSKNAALRMLQTNLCADVEGPDPGPERRAPWLYPVEAEKLFRCSRVPLRWRRLAALEIGLYTRPGEMETLGPDDIDLVAGVALIHQAEDPTEDGATKDTKTARHGVAVRRVPIEEMIQPLVEQLVARAKAEGSDRLVVRPPESGMAATLREYLRRAGCTRPELFANDRRRRPMRWRDLRATGITWRALRGDPPLAIQRAAGHTSLTTTQRYIGEAADVGLGVGKPFPALPPELLELGHPSDTAFANAVKQADRRRPQRDSNPQPEAPGRSQQDENPQIRTPIGLMATGAALELSAAVSESDIPPASLVEHARDAAAAAAAAFARGDIAEFREHVRDLSRFGSFGERRRGVPRYITDPRTKVTLTVSEWAALLGRTSQGLTWRLDTMSIAKALTPARKKAA